MAGIHLWHGGSFLYAAFTKRVNKEHYDAIFNQSAILHQRLFKSTGTAWEGDSITLRADIIRAIQTWSTLITEDSLEHTVIHDTMRVDARQREADIAMEQMRNILGVDLLGWVPNDGYKAAKEVACKMKAKMLAAAETPGYVTEVQTHFPFDDFDENC
ncbi:hypothetical protein BDW59DRAFT_178165 [Aspergillus cavernicola]|uniref:Uncharacterized protein n=1 Tax=Aspergillus cavernicola TaxID=176166 RepID=A0ABR4HE42_9EURO